MKKVTNDLFDYKDLKIVQGKEQFKFSLDSILLAEFVHLNPTTNKIMDLCTGNAPIPLILSSKTNCNIFGLELQKEIFDIALESVNINNKDNQIQIINDDCKNYKTYFKNESFDIVTCNPPYFKYKNDSLINEEYSKAVARHEIKINICDIIKIAFDLLKTNGSLCISHRPERLEEIILLLNEHKFSIKRMQFIYSKDDKEATVVLIEATKCGKKGLKILPPINIEKYHSYQNMFKE